MFLVISFDFGGSSNVCIHCLTSNITIAQNMYERVIESVNLENECNYDSTSKHLVELAEIDDEYLNEKGFIMFWNWENNSDKPINILRSNNTI
jgi:hypothetical protein